MLPIYRLLKNSYRPQDINAVLKLSEEGCTVPFIARYRKDRTGNLDEVAIREIVDARKKLEEVEKRQLTILTAIKEQGQLSVNLERQIRDCYDLTGLEDLYLPFKKRRKTKADIAIELGLEGLAKIIMAQTDTSIRKAAQSFLKGEVKNVKMAIEGAQDIIADWINNDVSLRQWLRQTFERHAIIESKVKRGKKEIGDKFRDFFQYSERLPRCPSHRFLAILRGEKEGILSVKISPEEDRTLEGIRRKKIKGYSDARPYIEAAITDAYKRLLFPSIENQVKQAFKEKADEEAIHVFALNVRQLLLSPPLGEKAVLAIDPGFRTGCKVACINANGQYLEYTTIFPHPPQKQSTESLKTIRHLIDKHDISAIAIGNGTAGRETLSWIEQAKISDIELHLVNENGASIYSASPTAQSEFPDLDLTVRGAISIGRRLMDPLAELIKIEPKSIGVGQYQHDVDQNRLASRLDDEVISCVNQVGVNLNTASSHLLKHISGLGENLALNIIKYRNANGPFQLRKELINVPRLGQKAFEQCSGFLRIRNGRNPLDNTGVHPETYPIVHRMAASLGVETSALLGATALVDRIDLESFVTQDTGLETLRDIVKELKKPGIDARGELEVHHFNDRIQSFSDLEEGMTVHGIVDNITNFGAFVDIGIKEAGLIHISEVSNTFIQHPSEKLTLNQSVKVKIIGLDEGRRRIQLSIKQV